MKQRIAAFVAPFPRIDGERTWILLRIVIGVGLWGYLEHRFRLGDIPDRTFLPAVCAYLVAALGLQLHRYRYPAHDAPRRRVGIPIDLCALSYGVYLAGEHGAALVPVYLWVVLGAGFHFGRRYLWWSTAPALIGFGVAAFGSTPRLLWGLSTALLLLIPAYCNRFVVALHPSETHNDSNAADTPRRSIDGPLDPAPAAIGHGIAETGPVDVRLASNNDKVVSLHRTRRHRPRILVAEDDASFRKMLATVLTSAGYRVTVAEDGERALECLGTGVDYDLVVLDMVMPGYGGIEVFQFLQASTCGAPRPPVLALTASATPALRERCEALGFARFLTKPIRPDRLIAVIEACLPPRSTLGSSLRPTESDPPLLDETTLEHLRALGECFFVEILAVFEQDLDTLLERLERATDHPSAFHNAAHALKGCAGSIGALRLQQAAEDAQHAEAHQLTTRAARLREIARATRRALQRWNRDAADGA